MFAFFDLTIFPSFHFSIFLTARSFLSLETQSSQRAIFFLIWREMPPNQNPQPRYAGQGYILLQAHEMMSAPNLAKSDNRRYCTRHLARRAVAFG
jgi:hypothetical protein